MLTLPAVTLLVGIAVLLAVMMRWQTHAADRRALAARAKVLGALGEAASRRHATGRADIRCADTGRQHHLPSGAVTVLGPMGNDLPRGDLPAPTSTPPPPIPPAPVAIPAPPRPEPSPPMPEPSPPMPEAAPPTQEPAPPLPEPVPTATSRTTATPKAGRPRGETRRRQPALALAAGAIVAIAATVLVATGLPENQRSATPPAADGDARAATDGSMQAAPHTSPNPPATEVTVLNPTIDPSGNEVFAVELPASLDLAAGDATWVQVVDGDGEVLLEETLGAGTTQRLEVASPTTIRLGNPAGILVAADDMLLAHQRPDGQPVTLSLR